MNVKPLIPMLNRIGEFFSTQPDHEEALQGIADHVRLFWEPRMRTAILDFLAHNPTGEGTEGQLLPLVVTALNQYKDELKPKLGV